MAALFSRGWFQHHERTVGLFSFICSGCQQQQQSTACVRHQLSTDRHVSFSNPDQQHQLLWFGQICIDGRLLWVVFFQILEFGYVITQLKSILKVSSLFAI